MLSLRVPLLNELSDTCEKVERALSYSYSGVGTLDCYQSSALRRKIDNFHIYLVKISLIAMACVCKHCKLFTILIVGYFFVDLFW